MILGVSTSNTKQILYQITYYVYCKYIYIYGIYNMNSKNLRPRHIFHEFPMKPLDTQRFFQGCSTLASTWRENIIQSEIIGKMKSRPKLTLHFCFLDFGVKFFENLGSSPSRLVDPPYVLPFCREESGGFRSEGEPCGRNVAWDKRDPSVQIFTEVQCIAIYIYI